MFTSLTGPIGPRRFLRGRKSNFAYAVLPSLLALLYSALCFGRSFASIIISSTVIDFETSSSSAAEVRSSSSSFLHTPGRHLSLLWVLDVRCFESEQNFNPFRSSLFCQKMASTHLKIFEDLEKHTALSKKSQTPGSGSKATIIIAADRSRRERAEIPPLLLLLAAVRVRGRRRLLLRESISHKILLNSQHARLHQHWKIRFFPK